MPLGYIIPLVKDHCLGKYIHTYIHILLLKYLLISCVLMHVYVCKHVCVCACEGQMSTSGVLPQSLSVLFLSQGLTEPGGL